MVDRDTGRGRRADSLLADGGGAPRPRAPADTAPSLGLAGPAYAAPSLGLATAPTRHPFLACRRPWPPPCRQTLQNDAEGRLRRHSRDDEDEEESPRNMRRRSSLVDGGSRGHFRNKAGVPRPVLARIVSLLCLACCFCRCPSAGDAVAVFHTPCPLMGCCRLDREGLACVALVVVLLK